MLKLLCFRLATNKTLLLLRIEQFKKEETHDHKILLQFCKCSHKSIYRLRIQKKECLSFLKWFRQIFREKVT